MSDATRTSRTSQPAVSPDLYVEVQEFYAHQMPLLETRKIEDFAQTFTEDVVFGYAGGWDLTGREELTAGLNKNIPALYGTSTIRHWFDSRRIEVIDADTLRVTQNSVVSVTDENGDVHFEPSCSVTDVLVRQDGALRTKTRVIAHDLTDPMRFWARFQNKS